MMQIVLCLEILFYFPFSRQKFTDNKSSDGEISNLPSYGKWTYFNQNFYPREIYSYATIETKLTFWREEKYVFKGMQLKAVQRTF